MTPEFTITRLLALRETPSSADYEAVYQCLQSATTEPLSWMAPGDEADFITELRIGELENPKKIVLTFSKWGNLCSAHAPHEGLVSLDTIGAVLNQCGWKLVPPPVAEMILYPASGATVDDCFFSYI